MADGAHTTVALARGGAAARARHFDSVLSCRREELADMSRY